MQLTLTYVSPEERAKLKQAEFTNVGNLHPKTKPGFNLRVKVQKEGTVPLVQAEAKAGRPSVLLCDSSARVVLWLPNQPEVQPEHAAAKALLLAASRSDAHEPLLVRGCEVAVHEGTLRVVLGAAATVTRGETPAAFGFLAPLLSEKHFDEEEELEGEETDAVELH